MYFFKKQGRQYLDLTGNLILSYNDRLIKARIPSASPHKALNAKYILNTGDLNLRGKIKATLIVMRFIWGKPEPLKPSDTDLKTPAQVYVDSK